MVSFTFEASGKIKLPSQEELEAADKDSAILAYASGTMDDGRYFYAYVAVKPSKYREFYQRTVARETFALGDYGDILAGAFDETPSDQIIQYMFETYGFDDHYEEKLAQQLTSQQEVFVRKQEDQRIQDIVTMLKRTPGETSS